ncbi:MULTISPECIES: sugar transferase [Vibrio]|uniref:Sugar transferase n=1 Tax=Vibrio mediterranei TaxID=689 RepID=A0A3G4VA68_9VIBR|nr:MULTISPECIES: sugar transferase [Vibrio]AYV21209.1 sugar transferase [Vibrio mediterranei]USE00329.1 sugar transferase [Vibrio sp. SCSIO 43133]
MNTPLTRLLDFVFAITGLCLLWPVMLVVYLVGRMDSDSPIFSQTRVGKEGKAFTLYKFRTMVVSTQSVATHMVDAQSVTKLGSILRKTKLDELPQLVNVLKGEMSFVGPRPCLFNQEELIEERRELGVDKVLPGITGLAQVNGIDMSEPKKLALVDARMISNHSLSQYFRLIIATAIGKGAGDRIR